MRWRTLSFSIPRVVVFRRFHHVRHFMAALGAHTLENQIPVALFAGELGDRYRVATLYAENVCQDSRSYFLGNRAPQHRCLRCELSITHVGNDIQSPGFYPVSSSLPAVTHFHLDGSGGAGTRTPRRGEREGRR